MDEKLINEYAFEIFSKAKILEIKFKIFNAQSRLKGIKLGDLLGLWMEKHKNLTKEKMLKKIDEEYAHSILLIESEINEFKNDLEKLEIELKEFKKSL